MIFRNLNLQYLTFYTFQYFVSYSLPICGVICVTPGVWYVNLIFCLRCVKGCPDCLEWLFIYPKLNSQLSSNQPSSLTFTLHWHLQQCILISYIIEIIIIIIIRSIPSISNYVWSQRLTFVQKSVEQWLAYSSLKSLLLLWFRSSLGACWAII